VLSLMRVWDSQAILNHCLAWLSAVGSNVYHLLPKAPYQRHMHQANGVTIRV
jgi:hypothetical protein